MTALMGLLLVLHGCGEAAESSSVCAPGESEACDCVNEDVTTLGERLCRAGGEEWTECLCTGDTNDAGGEAGDTTSPQDVSDPGPDSSDTSALPQDAAPAPSDTSGAGEDDVTAPDAGDPTEADVEGADDADADDADDADESDVPVCVPDCAEKSCGGDGCGGTCGACDAGWSCEDGECQAPPPCASDDDCAAISAAQPCWTFTCDAATGACVGDTFLQGDPCDDGDACTFNDLCVFDSEDQAACQGEPLPIDDDNDCTVDACDDGVITHSELADGEACDFDTEDCTTGDSCMAGECIVGEVLVLDDENPCTDDACIAGEVVHTALLEGACDDGDACTTEDSCVEGICSGGAALECTLGPCDAEAVCIPDEGCVASLVPADTPCDADDNVCTLDTCDAEGSCQATGESDTCEAESAADSCWTWVCNADSGCVTASFNAGVSCDDGDPCTEGDICTVNAAAEGSCSGSALPVDDGNACTADACVDGIITHTAQSGDLCIPQGCDSFGICLAGACLAPDGCACGNGSCGADEDCASCPADCGECGCTTDCAGKECGPDGCGGSCGTCAVGAPCTASGLCPN